MPRNSTGQVVELKRAGGRVFALRFRAYGRRRYLTIGSTDEGWTRAKAEDEMANVLADVRRGTWKPVEEAQPMPPGIEQPSFHEFASEWFEGMRLEGLRPNTLADYGWQLSNHLLPFFAEHRLGEITIAEVDRYRQQKVREDELSATSINKTITRLAQILEVAVERELIARNPARGKRRRIKQRTPERTWLDRSEQIRALLDAAGELDRAARADRRSIPRRTLLATLLFGGLRIGEALGLTWGDVDLAVGRLRVGQAKTDAGVRRVDLVPALREELSAHKAATRFPGPDDFVFPTEKGARQNPSNVRNRVLARSVEHADVSLAKQGANALPKGLTPHSLRRTYISLLLALGEEVPYVMRQVGHADPKVTLSIYAQVMFRGEGERERLRTLVEGSDWALSGTGGGPAATEPAKGGVSDRSELRTDAGSSSNARAWFRTRDLSRVKRALSH
jgi:integrase